MDGLTHFVVLYWEHDMKPADPPIAFCCWAEDVDHAESQCENAYPGCSIAWVVDTKDVAAAFDSYWNWDRED